LEENIRKVKLSTPDYRDMDPEQAMNDFRRRRGTQRKLQCVQACEERTRTDFHFFLLYLQKTI